MWLIAVSLTLGGVTIVMLVSRKWRAGSDSDFGWMSQQWLAEHRAGGRGG